MNARRIPFQFSTTDPLVRQRELEKRFGLPAQPKMYVDVTNPLTTGAMHKETSSPRLQHRVPIFAEGYDQPIHSSAVDSMASVHENKKPNVRVIPIEIEGAESKPTRHRTYSGPANMQKDREIPVLERKEESPFKNFKFEEPSKPKVNSNIEPRIYNIPIQIENADVPKSCNANVASKSKVVYPNANVASKSKVASPNANVASKSKVASPKANGCSVSKSSNQVESPKEEKVQQTDDKNDDPSKIVETLLKKIDDVLVEFKTYESGVQEFNGTSKDKQYRYLDEMLTRCMLRLDDINTMGNEDIRIARKNAVKKIQASIDLLESKANATSVESQVQETSELKKQNDAEIQDNEEQCSNTVLSAENKAISSEANQMDISVDGTVDSNCKTENEDLNVKLAEVSSQDKLSDSTDVEMSEIACDKTNDVGEASSFSEPSNNVPEVEMSESKSTKQNEVSGETVSSDIEMLDEKELHSSNDDQTRMNKSEVEMTDLEASSKESDEKKDSGSTQENANCIGDCSEPKSNSGNTSEKVDPNLLDVSVSVQDAEMKDTENLLNGAIVSETCNSRVTDLSDKQDTAKCESSQSERQNESLDMLATIIK